MITVFIWYWTINALLAGLAIAMVIKSTDPEVDEFRKKFSLVQDRFGEINAIVILIIIGGFFAIPVVIEALIERAKK